MGSLQAQRAPTTPAALDETRPAAINNPKPFTWTAEPDKTIAAVRHGHQALDWIVEFNRHMQSTAAEANRRAKHVAGKEEAPAALEGPRNQHLLL